MKKHLFALASLLLFCQPGLFAQIIPNAGFENWNTINLPQDPLHFVTSNSQVYLETGANVTRVTDQQNGDYAIRLETVEASGEVVPGVVSSGAVNISSFSFQGGFPYSNAPDSVTGYWKGDFEPNDSGFIVFVYVNNNQPVTFPVFKHFKGNVANYTRFSFPVPAPSSGVADSFFIAMSSGDLNNPKVGSVFYLDNLRLTGTTDSVYNQDFEHWINPSYEDPADWSTANFITFLDGELSASRTTDNHSGDYAVRIESIYSSVVEEYFGFIATGRIQLDGEFTGGIPTTAEPARLRGWYKYSPSGNDSAIAGVYFSKFNSSLGISEPVDSAFIKLPAASVYTPFEVPILYKSGFDHDTVAVLLSSTDMTASGTAREGSVLWVDDLEFTQPAPTVSFTNTALAITENDTTISVEISIQGANSDPTTVEVMLGSQSTATAGSDFEFTGTVVTFPASSSAPQTVDIIIKEDTDEETDETVVLLLRNASNLANLSDSIFTLTIEDNDPVGIEAGKANILQVRPNPSQEFITISGYTGKGNLTINDATGRKIMEIAIEERQAVDISGLKPGRYFITLQDAGNAFFQSSFLKIE
ncbi:MAG: Calx-beta domain-containing protein [Bacteroidia bacterium]